MEIVFKILWTDFAINQLKDIFDYHLIKASPNVAQRLVQKIIDATIILENNPKSGRKEVDNCMFRRLKMQRTGILYQVPDIYHINRLN